MKVTELKEALAKVKKADAMKIIVECYKAVPKNKKDELDGKILSLAKGLTAEKGKKAEPVINIDALTDEIHSFVCDADEGLYLRPNRTVSKTERSRWRFKAAKYFKTLLAFSPDNPEGPMIADSLCELYEIICDACNVHVFRTENPFSAIGWNQTELFAAVAEFALAQDKGDDRFFRKVIKLSIHSGAAFDNLPINQSYALWTRNLLKPCDYAKAAEILDKLRLSYKPQACSYCFYAEDYAARESYELACRALFSISVLQGNPVEGYDTFDENKSCIERNPEVTLYYALNDIFVSKSGDIWLKVYNRAVSKGIKPRESLVETYRELVKGNGK